MRPRLPIPFRGRPPGDLDIPFESERMGELSSWRRIVAQRDVVTTDPLWEPSPCADKALMLSTSKALRRAVQSLDMTQLQVCQARFGQVAMEHRVTRHKHDTRQSECHDFGRRSRASWTISSSGSETSTAARSTSVS